MAVTTVTTPMLQKPEKCQITERVEAATKE